MISAHVSVAGMSCAACAVNVQSALAELPGVKKAAVNYGDHSATIEFDERQAGIEQMRAALQAIGYDLNAQSLTVDEEESAISDEQRSLRLRWIICAAFTLPVVVTGMGFHHWSLAPWLSLVLTTPVMLIGGSPFFIRAFRQLRHGITGMDALVTLGTLSAFFLSLWNTLWPQQLSHEVYYESAAVVITLVLMGRWLEARARAGTGAALRALMRHQPATATRLRAGLEEEVPVSELQPGDEIVVKPGEKFPVDGIVTRGNSTADESMITGEAMPVPKQVQDKVTGGTLNGSHTLHFTATKVGAETLLSQIITLVKQAQGSRAPVQQLTDRIAAIFVPVVVGIALLTLAAWLIWAPAPALPFAIMRAVTVLVIACPCALGLATPTALIVGIGKGASAGILFKDAQAFEKANQIDLLVLDKTGTLTEGKPKVVAVQGNLLGEEGSVLLAMERSTNHPLAAAVVQYLEQQGLRPHSEMIQLRNEPGRGIACTLGGVEWWLRSENAAREDGIRFSTEADEFLSLARAAGHSLALFGRGRELQACLALADQVKPGAHSHLQQLKAQGIEIAMLSGDHPQAVERVAAQVGIARHAGAQSPADKFAAVKQWQQQGRVVAMAGDGVNDGPALAAADLSIAMGNGEDVARETASVVLVQGDLSRLPLVFAISRATLKTVRQNLGGAFLYNIVGIPLAAGLLYPVNGWLMSPMIAGAAMALSSVTVVANSLLLKYRKLN